MERVTSEVSTPSTRVPKLASPTSSTSSLASPPEGVAVTLNKAATMAGSMVLMQTFIMSPIL